MKVKSQVTLEDILSKVSEEQLFRYYIPNFIELNKKFKSPFNNEKTASCYVVNTNGRLFYKDFSSGNGGNILHFIQTKYNLNYNECINVIASDFNLKPNLKLNIKPIELGINTRPKELVTIKIKSINFTKEGLDYWKQYGLDKEDLINVKQISYFWIGYNRFKVDSIAFAYDFGNSNYQILQPYSKEFKWNSNTSNYLIMGYNNLPKLGDLLIITSSYKDVLVLNKLGYNSIAPKSESTLLSELQIFELKERFKKIVIYFNNDKIGLEYAKKYNKLYGLEYIYNPINEPKDPSDFVKKLGIDKLKEFLKCLLKEKIQK